MHIDRARPKPVIGLISENGSCWGTSRRCRQGTGPSFETQLSLFRNFVLVGRLGKRNKTYAASEGVIVSNLVFSAPHAHIGLAFALVMFIPGLF